MPIELLPVGIFYVGALLAALGRDTAPWVAVATPLAAAAASFWLLAPGVAADWSVMDYSLAAVRADGMSLAFVALFHVAALATAVYALEWNDRLQAAAMLGYIGSGVGAVLAGDLVTLWLFWEMLALTSVLLVWARGTAESTAAGIRYLVFNVLSGVILLAGIGALAVAGNDLMVGPQTLDSPGAWLLLIAFGVKAGFPMLHSWIPDAYPKSSLVGSVILVAVTTKVGVYALARTFAGEELLLAIGTLTALWPLYYVLVEDDLRRVLAYSLMVQIGLMIAAVGAGNAIALDGVTLHVVMDVLFKLLLFMALGAVFVRAGTVRASELGGLGKSMPWTMAFVAVGVLANAGMPGTGAFVSKKLLLGGLEHAGIAAPWYALLTGLSAVGLLYVGVRVLFEAFIAPARKPVQVSDASWPMRIAMGGIALLLLATGLVPGLTDALRPFGSDYDPVKATKILGQIQLLVFALLAYALMARAGLSLPQSGRRTLLDTEWIYRRLIPSIAIRVADALGGTSRALGAWIRLYDRQPGSGWVGASLGRSWPTGSMAFWTVTLLVVLLFAGVWKSQT